MAAEISVRKAEPSDAALLSSLCADIQRIHAEHVPDLFKQPDDELFAKSFFEEQLAAPDSHILLALHSKEATGYVFLRLRRLPENIFQFERHLLHVDQIGVRPAWRGEGIGGILIDAAWELARELGVDTVTLDTWRFNTGAQHFFSEKGFEPFNIRYWRIRPPADERR